MKEYGGTYAQIISARCVQNRNLYPYAKGKSKAAEWGIKTESLVDRILERAVEKAEDYCTKGLGRGFGTCTKEQLKEAQQWWQCLLEDKQTMQTYAARIEAFRENDIMMLNRNNAHRLHKTDKEKLVCYDLLDQSVKDKNMKVLGKFVTGDEGAAGLLTKHTILDYELLRLMFRWYWSHLETMLISLEVQALHNEKPDATQWFGAFYNTSMINFFLHITKNAKQSGIEAADKQIETISTLPRGTQQKILLDNPIERKHWPQITEIHRDVFEPFDLLSQVTQLSESMEAPGVGVDHGDMEELMLDVPNEGPQAQVRETQEAQPGDPEAVQEPPKKKGRKPLDKKTLASISESVDAEMESIFNSVTTGAAVASKESVKDGASNGGKGR